MAIQARALFTGLLLLAAASNVATPSFAVGEPRVAATLNRYLEYALFRVDANGFTLPGGNLFSYGSAQYEASGEGAFLEVHQNAPLRFDTLVSDNPTGTYRVALTVGSQVVALRSDLPDAPAVAVEQAVDGLSLLVTRHFGDDPVEELFRLSTSFVGSEAALVPVGRMITPTYALQFDNLLVQGSLLTQQLLFPPVYTPMWYVSFDDYVHTQLHVGFRVYNEGTRSAFAFINPLSIGVLRVPLGNGEYLTAVLNLGISQVSIDTLGLPEPSAWAMMIIGFGLVGASLRSGRRGYSTEWS